MLASGRREKPRSPLERARPALSRCQNGVQTSCARFLACFEGRLEGLGRGFAIESACFCCTAPWPRARCLLSGGTYVAVLAKGDSQEKAFGYAYAVIAAAALKAGLVNAGEVGMGKAPFFVWGAIASYIAYAAINE